MNAHMPIEPALDSFDEIAAEVHAEEAARLKSRGASFEDVKAASLRSIDTVLGKYLFGGKLQANGKEYVVLNPVRSDKKAGSFTINRHNGVWSDFSTGESGGDMIDLVMYLTGRTNIEAKNELAELLAVQARSGSTDLTGNIRDTRPKQQKVANIAATPLEASSAPAKFPPRTPPDDKGKPGFVVAGAEGPKRRDDELRRHYYRQGGVPVRIKIVKKESALNVYRVTGADGETGWQYAKPKGIEKLPYFAGSNPFDTTADQIIFWTEGEKDAETTAALGGLAFTFGGCGDGVPDACEQYVKGRHVVILADNDEAGRKHAEDKAALASTIAASIKVIHFTELAEKGDVSDWIATGKTFEDLKARVVKTEAWQPSAKPETEKPKEPKHELPYGYAFSDRGLMWTDPEGAESKPLHIAGCFDVEAMTRDGDSGRWGTLLRWKDPDGKDHRYALAHEHLAGDGAEARRILMDQGFYIAPSPSARTKLNAFLLQVRSPNRALATDRVGWNGTAFVLPDECFGGKPGETLLLQNAAPHEHLFRQAGTLEEWQEIPRLAQVDSCDIDGVRRAVTGSMQRGRRRGSFQRLILDRQDNGTSRRRQCLG